MLSDKRIKRYLSMAKSASELSDYIHNKVGCIFVYKKDIVAVGYNHKVTSPLQKNIINIEYQRMDEYMM